MKSVPYQEDVFTLTSKQIEVKENVTQEMWQRTAFQKACYDLTHSETVMNDLMFGQRVGLYKLRGEIGSGNFSQVRFGLHDLTKGEILATFSRYFHSCSGFRLTVMT